MSLTGLFVFSIFAIFWVGSLFHPLFGVAGYLFVYIVYDPTIWWNYELTSDILSPSFISMVFLFAGCILHWQRLNFKIVKGELYIYLFLGLAWLTTIVSNLGLDGISLVYLAKLSKLLVFVFLFNRVVNSFSHLRFILWIVIAGGLFLGYQAHVATAGMFTSGRLDEVGGVDFNEANSLAGILSLAVALLAYKLLLCGWPRRILYVPIIGLLLNAIVMTRSRAVFLGMLVAAPFMAIMAPTGYRKKILIFICLGAILFFALSDYTFLTRMQSIEYNAALLTLSGSPGELSRVDFWKAALRMIADHPFGVGIKHYERLISTYDRRIGRMDAHNTYVLCCAETGILGMALFMVIIAQSFLSVKRAFRNAVNHSQRSEVEIIGCSLFAALLIITIGLMTTHSILYSGMLWILLSLPIIYERVVSNAVTIEEGEAQERLVPSGVAV
jgi:O-antigen ligase